MSRILSISYDASLLATRELMLQRAGHKVTSVTRLKDLPGAPLQFDLIVMGHSIPQPEKRAMIADLRQRGCDAPVLAVLRANEHPLPEAADSAEADPDAMLEAVFRILGPDDHDSRSAKIQ